jgi:hypothetical protein
VHHVLSLLLYPVYSLRVRIHKQVFSPAAGVTALAVVDRLEIRENGRVHEFVVQNGLLEDGSGVVTNRLVTPTNHRLLSRVVTRDSRRISVGHFEAFLCDGTRGQ